MRTSLDLIPDLEIEIMVFNHQVPTSEWHPDYVDNEQTVLVLSGLSEAAGVGKRGGGGDDASNAGGDDEQRLGRRSLTKRLKGGG